MAQAFTVQRDSSQKHKFLARVSRDLFKKSKETSDIANIMAQKAGTSKSPGKAKLNTKLRREHKDSGSSGGTDSPGPSDTPGTSGGTPAKKVKKEEREEPDVKIEIDDESQNGETKHSPSKGKSECKYGATCYQTNEQHKSKFSHPGSENTKGLANIFNGISAYIPTKLPDYNKLKRYIIAYNGDVVDDYAADDATHIVVGKHIKEAGEKTQLGKYVKTDWIWECIKQKRMIPEGQFVPDC